VICENYILLVYRGPDGELGAATRYLSQRYTAPTSEVKGILNDIGIYVPILHIQSLTCHKKYPLNDTIQKRYCSASIELCMRKTC
jgi:spore coat protein JC